jgi:small subunit ribosomal protein S4
MLQLREKQKVKRMYGLLEKQFHNTFQRAAMRKGVTGHLLLEFLERRLDNVVYRLGFGSSHADARQLVRHGHIHVNGRKVNIPSYQVKEGDEVVVRDKSRKMDRVTGSVEAVERRGVPGWLELDKGNFSGKVARLPVREDITMPINEQLIVELYSK